MVNPVVCVCVKEMAIEKKTDKYICTYTHKFTAACGAHSAWPHTYIHIYVLIILLKSILSTA